MLGMVLMIYNACSYCGAQIFEIYGLGEDVVDTAFCGSVSRIGGLTLDEVSALNTFAAVCITIMNVLRKILFNFSCAETYTGCVRAPLSLSLSSTDTHKHSLTHSKEGR